MGSNIHWNAAPIDIPTNSAHVFHFIHILTDILFPFCYIIVTGTRWYLITVLSCITLMISNVKHFFHLSIGHLYVFFGKMFGQTRPSAQFLKIRFF